MKVRLLRTDGWERWVDAPAHDVIKRRDASLPRRTFSPDEALSSISLEDVVRERLFHRMTFRDARREEVVWVEDKYTPEVSFHECEEMKKLRERVRELEDMIAAPCMAVTVGERLHAIDRLSTEGTRLSVRRLRPA